MHTWSGAVINVKPLDKPDLESTVDPHFKKHGFSWIPLYIVQNLSAASFLTIKTLIQSLSSTDVAFNEFLIISNKNIGFLLKSYNEFSGQYHIFELRSLFGTFESLKFIEFSMQAVVGNSNSKYFRSNASSFQITFSVRYEKTLQSRKQQAKICIFHTVIRLWRWLISFKYIKLSKNNFSWFSNPFWKVWI